MPEQLAIWNSNRDVWEATGAEATTCLFCGHSDVYSETFTTSGMTRNGVAYALPTWEPRTDGSASSSSPDDADLLGTPTSRMWKGAGPQGGPTQIRNKARGLIEAQVMDLLPTTTAADAKASGGAEGSANVTLTDAIVRGRGLLPTPRTSDTNGPGLHGDGGMDLRTAVTVLPTPRATRGGSGTETMYLLGAERSDDDRPQGEVIMRHATDWGPYAPAIHRWERALGRPAPSPTEPNKAGKPRLSPAFTEWLMGVPEGWICDTPGISRNDMLKAAGNGVVVAQAATALKDMLRSFDEDVQDMRNRAS